MVGTEGIAPSASCMSGRRSAAELRPRKWCSRLGSHQRPPTSDDGALLTELRERIRNAWSGRPDLRRRSPAPHAGALAATLRPDSNGGRDGTRTHFFHRDRVDSRLFEFTPTRVGSRGWIRTTTLPVNSRRLHYRATREWEMVGAERLARSRLPDSESGGSAIPREPRAAKLAFLAGLAPASDSP